MTKSGTDESPNFTFDFKNLKGEQGLKGDKGDKGDPGPKGDKGDQGKGATIGTIEFLSSSTGQQDEKRKIIFGDTYHVYGTNAMLTVTTEHDSTQENETKVTFTQRYEFANFLPNGIAKWENGEDSAHNYRKHLKLFFNNGDITDVLIPTPDSISIKQPFTVNEDNTVPCEMTFLGMEKNNTKQFDLPVFLPNTAVNKGIVNTGDALALTLEAKVNSANKNYELKPTLTLPAAATDKQGLVQLATQDEVNTGANTTKVITPATLGKGKASGVASLDSNSKIITSQLPDYLLGQVMYGGNASTVATTTTISPSDSLKTKKNITATSISIVDSATSTTANTYGWQNMEGVYFICQASGTFAGVSFETGDWIISTGAKWEKIDNTDAVKSVNGQTGAVNITRVDEAGTADKLKTARKISITGDVVGETTFDGSADKEIAVTFTKLASTSAFGVMKVGAGLSVTDGVVKVTSSPDIDSAPVLSADGTNITVKVGTKISTAFTVPFATNATSAVNATNATNATNAGAATNVTTNINGKAIASIFEANGTTVKSATNAVNATNATNATNAVNATTATNIDDGTL